MNLFGHLFCEYFTYCRKRCKTLEETEKMLYDVGYDVGVRMWELFLLKERTNSTEKSINTKNELQQCKQVLEKIKDKYWRFLFGKPADSLEKIKSADQQYYLIDKKPLTDQYISYQANYKGSVPSSLLTGVIKAATDACGIDCAVQVHLVEQQGEYQTYFHIKCAPDQK